MMTSWGPFVHYVLLCVYTKMPVCKLQTLEYILYLSCLHPNYFRKYDDLQFPLVSNKWHNFILLYCLFICIFFFHSSVDGHWSHNFTENSISIKKCCLCGCLTELVHISKSGTAGTYAGSVSSHWFPLAVYKGSAFSSSSLAIVAPCFPNSHSDWDEIG